MRKSGDTYRQRQGKSVKKRLKAKVLKKINLLNVGIAVFCVLVGYLIVFSPFTQNRQAGKGSLDEVTRSVNRIADSFELYNNKRFVQPGQ